MLETQRLILRGWRDTDFEPFAAIYADEEQAQFIGGACERDQAWARMAAYAGHWTLRGYGLWALEGKADGAFKGWSGLVFPESWPEREIGWTLVRSARGNGLATEAAARARAYAYEVLGWTTAISIIRPANAPSIRVAERLGAKRERIIEFRFREAEIYRHPGPRELSQQQTKLH